jgi:hypothetical protein
MTGMKILHIALISAISFCGAGLVAYVVFWHAAGLDIIGRDDTGVALGAFAVFVKSVLVGTVTAISSGILAALFFRRRPRGANSN